MFRDIYDFHLAAVNFPFVSLFLFCWWTWFISNQCQMKTTAAWSFVKFWNKQAFQSKPRSRSSSAHLSAHFQIQSSGKLGHTGSNSRILWLGGHLRVAVLFLWVLFRRIWTLMDYRQISLWYSICNNAFWVVIAPGILIIPSRTGTESLSAQHST